ncbi:MAG: non-canonical purine NTP pyrophosphatase, partial [Bacteroidales bacterium]|nr:non-canonical purine NTP pyrophosphatase [Bacteroidales bacterium]
HTREGHIALEPQGELGFGYDPVFVPEGMECTMAMISLEEKNRISHRGKAMEKLVCHLQRNLE